MGLGEELRLAWFVSVNAVVLASAWRIASRLGGRSLSQALLDTLLLNYLIQYVIVCGLGACGILSPINIAYGVMVVGAGTFLSTHLVKSTTPRISQMTHEGRIAMAILLFAAGYLLSYALDRRYLPVLETDALAYHLPTAIGWLQSGHLKLFEAWYWNPANSFSPLAAEAFMAWAIAPMQSDIFVRYVQTPALLIVGLAMYRIGRHLGARPIVAACVAVAAMLSRSIFAQATLVKDDLFVAAFFLTAVAAMGEVGSQNEEGETHHDPIAPWRIGIAVGLLVATKYPALLTLPLLILLMPSLLGVWTAKQWILAFSIVAILAGPWFIRNWITWDNPLFPMIIRIGGHTVWGGVFNVTRDASTRTPSAIWSMVTHGYFGTPAPFLLILMSIWVIAAVMYARQRFSSKYEKRPSTVRFAIWGPIVGPIVFSLASPHPEIRYFFPFLLPLFAAASLGLRLFDRLPRLQIATVTAIALAATMTSFESGLLSFVARFAEGGIIIATLGLAAAILWMRFKRIVIGIAAVVIAVISLPMYVNWRVYARSVVETATTVWPNQYGPIGQAWIAARDELPANATIAYANTYLIYPLYGSRLERRVLYAPVRSGEITFADLPNLGDRVPQSRIVETVTAAMNQGADEATWLNNLNRLGVTDLFIAKHERSENPPELQFTRDHPELFQLEFENDAASIYHRSQKSP